MTKTQRKAMQQALEALTNCSSQHGHRCGRCDSEVDEGGKVVAALRAALAEPEPEPVASPARRPLTEDQRGALALEHLELVSLTDGAMSLYDAFMAGLNAAERAHGIGGNDE